MSCTIHTSDLLMNNSLVPQGGLVCEECPLGLSAFLTTRPPTGLKNIRYRAYTTMITDPLTAIFNFCVFSLYSRPQKKAYTFVEPSTQNWGGARQKMGGSPHPPLSWSKLGQASFWNSKKWLYTNKNHEETLFRKIAKFQNSHWLPCIWRKTRGFNLRNLCF